MLVTGASGFIGSALVQSLAETGHTVMRLARAKADAGAGHLHWDPASGTLQADTLEGMDAVVHLAGEDIASGSWTEAKKARIRESRVNGTSLLAQTLARLSRRPAVLASASAVGYYGDRGDEVLTEDSPAGSGFLASVLPGLGARHGVSRRGRIRVLHLRFGVVLSPSGGALARMLGPFRKGMGGPIGGGRQYVSWIARTTRSAPSCTASQRPRFGGGERLIAKPRCTQAEFTGALGRVLHRPTLLSVPAFGVRLMFGEMAGETLLAASASCPRASSPPATTSGGRTSSPRSAICCQRERQPVAARSASRLARITRERANGDGRVTRRGPGDGSAEPFPHSETMTQRPRTGNGSPGDRCGVGGQRTHPPGPRRVSRSPRAWSVRE